MAARKPAQAQPKAAKGKHGTAPQAKHRGTSKHATRKKGGR